MHEARSKCGWQKPCPLKRRPACLSVRFTEWLGLARSWFARGSLQAT